MRVVGASKKRNKAEPPLPSYRRAVLRIEKLVHGQPFWFIVSPVCSSAEGSCKLRNGKPYQDRPVPHVTKGHLELGDDRHAQVSAACSDDNTEVCKPL